MNGLERNRTHRPIRLLPLVAAVCLVSHLGGAITLSAEGESEPAATDSCWPGSPGTDPTACPPDDPRFSRRWEFSSTIPPEVDRSRMHPAEVALGSIGFSLDAAWQHTVGRDDVVIAVLDSGIRWDYADLVNKLYLNPGELPTPQGSDAHDRNGDGLFNIQDYAGDSRVEDRNGNGRLDPQDLIAAFSDCRDDDGNGYPDDISGYDFFGGTHCEFAGGDNDPADDTDFGHGTGIASTAAAETNNGIRDAGVCPRCRVLPVRVGDSFVVDANQFARGVVFAVHAGADVIASALGSYNNTPAARHAVDFAYERGVTIVASAADEFSYHHNYPSVYNHTLVVNAIRYNDSRDFRKASTFWGVNPCTNFGARIWVTMPAVSCSSGATSRLAGVVGLVESAARDAGLGSLHAGEVLQVLRETADDLDNSSPDWGDLYYRGRPGFDQYYGYGRVHALAAVEAVRRKRIPPIVDLHNPRWFAVVSPARAPRFPVAGSIDLPRVEGASYRLEIARGVEPQESEYRRVAEGRVQRALDGRLGTVDLTRLPPVSGAPPRHREERDRYSVTLRLRVVDDSGLTAEARRSFFVLDDPTWMTHFPVDLDVSGEATPLLVDLDGDDRDEIVLATADGVLHIFDWERGGLRELRAALDTRAPVDPNAGRQAASSVRETVIRGAVAGDLTGDGTTSIVVASREGKIYAFTARGERRAGFPVTVLPAERATPELIVEAGMLSRPVLADLDGRPGLEIVAGALDGRLYAWHGNGRPLAGFPVELKPAVRAAGARAKSVSTPAVGDLDGDGRPEIVLGSNGLQRDLSAVYAVRSTGNAHPAGALLPGWDPLQLAALRPDLLPTVGTGVSMDPILVDADADGDLEAILYAVTDDEIVLVDQPEAGPPRIARRYSMMPAAGSGFRNISFLTGTGSPLVADTRGNGELELYAPLISFRLLTLRSKPGMPLDVPLGLGGWRLGPAPATDASVPMLPSFPRRMEDLMLFARPAAADVDGDGVQEVLMGSGGYLLHAFRVDGGEAEGFPKFTGGWIFSAPVTGDLDGDGRLELVTVTREGYLFAWTLTGPQNPAISTTR